MNYREYQPGELGAISELLNGVFRGFKVGPEMLKSLPCDEFTVAVAEDNGKIVGAIPMVRRAYKVAPGATLDTWIQFRVGVSDACRGQGVGKSIQDAAFEFLKKRGDIILIISTSEGARAYSFYRANGFHDVSYVRSYRMEPPENAPADNPAIFRMSANEFYEAGEQWREIFNTCYADFGGYPLRTPRYLSPARAAALENLGMCFAYWGVRKDGRDVGYMILTRGKNTDQVMEIAMRDNRADLAAELICAARSPAVTLAANTTGNSLLDRAFQQLGFSSPLRNNAFVVKPLNIPAIGNKIRQPVPGLENVEVRVWTPEREEMLFAAAGELKRKLTIQLKEDMLARLLVRRLDMAVALREERITLQGAVPGDVEALAEALRPCPWVFHEIDGL